MLSEQEKTTFILTNYAYVRRLALKLSPVPDSTEDIVQQVFLEVSEKWDKWDFSEDIKPLLVVITRRVSQKFWRHHLRQLPEAMQEIAETIRQMSETDLAPEQHADEIEALRNCLLKLPPRSRKIIEMYYYQDFSARALAEKLDMKSGGVWSAVCRIRASLRQCIQRILKTEVSHAPAE